MNNPPRAMYLIRNIFKLYLFVNEKYFIYLHCLLFLGVYWIISRYSIFYDNKQSNSNPKY